MNKTVKMLRDGLLYKLHIAISDPIMVPAGEERYHFVQLPFSKINIQSLEVNCNKQTRFAVEFFEDTTLTDSQYNSGEVSGRLLDVLSYSYVDKEETDKLHLLIRNLDVVDATYTVEVRGFQLK